MEKFTLKDVINGWFIGDFDPSLYKTSDFEVAVKSYSAGDYEGKHYHKIATEFTVILDGSVEMNNQVHNSGDIIRINPGTPTDFKALTDVKTVVIKVPSSKNDKYIY